MTNSVLAFASRSILFAILVARASGAESSPDPLDARSRAQSPANRPSATADARGKSATARGPLPDPALLDGSKLAAEKKSEYGMLGEFEMPGGEEKSDKVGGQSEKSGGGGQSGEKSPSGGGGGGQQQSAQGGSQGGEASSAQASQGGGGASGDPSQKGSGSGSIAQNDPNAKAEGAQSSGLSSPNGGGAASQSDAMPAKPGQMQIGDAQMQIKTLPTSASASVVGLQQPVGKDVPQAYDAKTPGGGKQSGGGGNKGVEKGRAMPAGL